MTGSTKQFRGCQVNSDDNSWCSLSAHGVPRAAQTFPRDKSLSSLLWETGSFPSSQASDGEEAGRPGFRCAPGRGALPSPPPSRPLPVGYIRLEVSLSAPPRALKAPWTFWTCSVSPKESLWMTWVMSGFCGWAVALCVDTWKLPGTWGEGQVSGVWGGFTLEPDRPGFGSQPQATRLWRRHCPTLSARFLLCGLGQ